MKKTLVILLSAALILALLCGCGASAKSDMTYPSAPSYADNSAKASSGAGGAGWMGEVTYEMADAPAMKPTEQAIGQKSGDGTNGSGLPANVKLIYRATIDMESTEFDEAVAGLNDLVSSLGGYFETSELNNYANYRHGSYTVRLPAENFETFCTAVGELCQVNSLSRSAEDVSERYYDTESRLVTQQTKLARLQELLRKAEEMEDIITLESAISETELAIEQLTGTLRKYDSLVNYATVTLYLAEVYKLSTIEQPAIGFGAKLAAAFRSGAKRFGNGFQNFLLSVARNWIGWLIFIIIVVAAVLIVLKAKRRRAARAAARSAFPPPQSPPQQPPQNPQEPRQ